MSSSGHVFIVHGDLRKVACDAWLMPCGADAVPGRHWWTERERADSFRWPAPPPDWQSGSRRAFALHPDDEDAPAPWLVHVGGGRAVGIEWYIAGVWEFMERVADSLEGREPLHGRDRHLVALPVIGTGYGGMRHRTGEVVRELLPCLYESARRYEFDVALVLFEDADFAAAQRTRLRFTTEGGRWPVLDDELRAEADRLAEIASRGELVVFFGSGASRSAGIPTWGEMLRVLSEDAGQSMDIDWRELQNWSYTDQARILEHGFGGRAPLEAAVVGLMRRERVSLAHSMLASLPVEAFVTTNYDTLFEQASEAIDRPLAVLPYESASGRDRWLLKMHGCINHPDDIVLTREGFMRYTARRGALAGIVQALLITSHMIFVGFSLDDDNFQRIADDVRKVVRASTSPGTGDPFGTALLLQGRPFLAQLWEDEVDMVVMDRVGDGRAATMEQAARRLEIFLDYLIARVSDPAYLLDDRFGELLSESERALRDRLYSIIEGPDILRQSPAWSKLAELLGELGWHEE